MSRESFQAMQVVEVTKDSTATRLVVALMHNGAALDLSSATGSKLYNAKTIEEAAVVTDGSASFYTDGTDGKLSIALTSALVGTIRDLIVDTEVQGYNGGNLVSRAFILRTIPRGKGT